MTSYLDSPILDILVVAYGLLRLPTVSANQPFWNGHLKIEKLKRPLKNGFRRRFVMFTLAMGRHVPKLTGAVIGCLRQ